MKTKVIFFLFFMSFLFKAAIALEVKCNFEEVYSTGEVQNGIFLFKDKKMRYQYFKDKLYTIIYKDNKFFLIHNHDNKIVQKVEKNTEVMKLFSEIVQSYPKIKDRYIKENTKILVEKSSNNFIKRVSVQSSQVNLSINIMNCKFSSIDDKYFKHFDLAPIN